MSQPDQLLLRYTGHPLVDVGVATITSFANKEDPAEVTQDDLDSIASYMERQYTRNPMKSFLSVVFPNSGFTQPAFDKHPAKRTAYAHKVLRAWQHEPALPGEQCVFFGTPATLRAHREMIPLIGSIEGFNFYAGGVAGLPVSADALLAIHAFPLGCMNCGGRILLLHSEHTYLTHICAARALERNRRYLDMASHGDKYTKASYPRTQIINQLVASEQDRRDLGICSVTAYHLTNYGTNPGIDFYHLPQQIIAFLYEASDAAYRQAWRRLVQRAWEGGDGRSIEPPSRDDVGLPARRNVLYEDLFTLPMDAHRFLRTYLLRRPVIERTSKDDQRRTYRLATELDMVSWPLTRLFIERILNVDNERIDAIRAMADRLAEYIQRENDRRLFQAFLHGGNRWGDYQELRNRLIAADHTSARTGTLLFTLDEFTSVFYSDDDAFWWLIARDLVLIRLIEQLHHAGWIGPQSDILERTETTEVEAE
jgi:CRISPR-associated protein Cst1